MAKYSDNREQNLEVKYLYKVWLSVDNKVRLPTSLSGDALLPLLDDLPGYKPVSRKIRFSPRIFTWKSGVTYAAAFVLIIALSALLGRGNPSTDLLVGNIAPAPGELPQVSADLAVELWEEEEQTAQPPMEPDTADTTPTRSDAPSGNTETSTAVSGTGNEPAPDSHAAVGGQSQSVLLGTEGEYTYTYRLNDATDPDKAGFPITVNIMHTSSGTLAFQMDVEDMLSVDRYFLYEETITLVGGLADGDGVSLHTYDISQVGEPVDMGSYRQFGSFLDARLYKNVVSLFTFAPAGMDPECEVVDLPNSIEEGMCIVTTVDIETMQTQQIAFAGSGNELSLYNLNAYLSYEGEKTEENEHGYYVAHIRLDGMNVELRNEQQ